MSLPNLSRRNTIRAKNKVGQARTSAALVLVAASFAAGWAQTPAPAATPVQEHEPPHWQVVAGGKLAFDVASVRQNKSAGSGNSNVSSTSTDEFIPPGGLYRATNIGLIQYVAFAYKLSNKQLQSVAAQIPWSTQDRFDIEARAAGNPTKDQFRLMMQSLLAERFKLAAHFETREVPVYALVFAKPGKWGPQLRPHRQDDPACLKTTTPQLPQSSKEEGEFPSFCGGIGGLPPSAPGRMRNGARGITLATFAAIESGVGNVERPIIDRTQIEGMIDFNLEWRKVAANLWPGEQPVFDEDAPAFRDALQEQLGLKLVPQTGPIEFFVIDHVERPDPN